MEKILTIEDFYEENTSGFLDEKECKKLMLNFAKIHIKEALKQIIQNAKIRICCGDGGLTVTNYTTNPKDVDEYEIIVDEYSILEAYPLENIK